MKKVLDYEKYKIFCFDFDGVICESSHIKTEAYESLFIKKFPEKIDEIMKYHIQNAGIIRYIKLRYIWENIIGHAYTPEIEKALIFEYENMVKQAVIDAAFVNGVIDLIKDLYKKNYILYIISGTPDEEMKLIAEKKNIMQYFKDIYGGSQNKTFWLNKIKQEENTNNLIFFGDAYNDYEAAVETDIDFVFRVNAENEKLLEQMDQEKIFLITDFK